MAGITRAVETFIGTVFLPATIGPTGIAGAASATATGASSTQTGTVTVGTPALPIITADVSVLNLNIVVTAYIGAALQLAGLARVLLCYVVLNRVEPDNATAANQTVNTIVTVPVYADVVNGVVQLPTKKFCSIGAGCEYGVDFGAYVTASVVLASGVTSLTYSWSLTGKS